MITRMWCVPNAELAVVLSLHNKEMPSCEAWDEYLEVLVEAVGRKGGARFIRALSISDGGGPSARQREQLNALMRRFTGGRGCVAIVTADPIVRGMVKALSWVNPQARAFAPRQLSSAIDYLGVTDEHRRDRSWY